LAGTIVGVVEKSKILNGDKIKKGDVVLALPSTGLHTNGYSLARAVLFPAFDPNQHLDELGGTLADALLAVHRSYYPVIWPLLEKGIVNGLSHITGGGIEGNTNRVVPKDLTLTIDWDSWQWPALFSLIQKQGNVPVEDMRRTFNLGIGLCIIVSPEHVAEVTAMLAGETVMTIGSIE
jgi:phosphoribosylformylglycinamidine cyclo-ligase